MYNLSVIIPIYNTEKYLDECLKSVINDSKDVEYILIDDGSSDNSSLIYSKYANLSNVKIIKNKNHGVSYSRNYGLRIAEGKYIMFVDSDDYLAKNWYEIIKKEIDESYDLIIFSKWYDNEECSKLDFQLGCINSIDNKLRKCNIMCPVSKLYKKDFIDKNNISFDTNIINGEDMIFNFECISLNAKIKILQKEIYYYRINANSATQNFNDKIFESDIQFHLKLEKLALKDENYIKLKESIEIAKINGLYIIINRLAGSDKKNKLAIIEKLIEKDIYKEVLENYDDNNIFPFLERKIIKLIQTNKIKLAIFLINTKNNIKKIKSINQKTLKYIEI